MKLMSKNGILRVIYHEMILCGRDFYVSLFGLDINLSLTCYDGNLFKQRQIDVNLFWA